MYTKASEMSRLAEDAIGTVVLNVSKKRRIAVSLQGLWITVVFNRKVNFPV
jgi:hypothetical protein